MLDVVVTKVIDKGSLGIRHRIHLLHSGPVCHLQHYPPLTDATNLSTGITSRKLARVRILRFWKSHELQREAF
jgi:hypothetical protein